MTYRPDEPALLGDASLFFQFRMVPTLYMFPHARLHVALRASLLPDTGAVRTVLSLYACFPT